MQPRQRDQQHGQPNQVAQRYRVQSPADRAHHRYRQQHHDRLQDQRRGHHPPKALPGVRRRLVLGAIGAVRGLGHFAHCGSRPNSVRTAPAVTIGPETSSVAGALGLTVRAEAATHDLDGLVAAVRGLL